MRGLLLALILVLVGCSEEAERLFKQGDIVEFVVNGQRAQVIHVNYCEAGRQKRGAACTYDVRVFLPTSTGVTSRISRIDYVKEYELRRARE